MPAYPYLSPKEAFPEAKAAAQRALEIDPTLAEAHTFLAYSLVIYDWNWAEAEQSFKRAIELDPNNVSAHFRYGLQDFRGGRSAKHLIWRFATDNADVNRVLAATARTTAMSISGCSSNDEESALTHWLDA